MDEMTTVLAVDEDVPDPHNLYEKKEKSPLLAKNAIIRRNVNKF